MREITAGNLGGDKNAAHLRDVLFANAGHVSTLIGDASTAATVMKLAASGNSLGEAMNALNQEANLAPQYKVVADAVAAIAGDVTVSLVPQLGGLDGRYFSDSQEIHIVSDGGRQPRHESPFGPGSNA